MGGTQGTNCALFQKMIMEQRLHRLKANELIKGLCVRMNRSVYKTAIMDTARKAANATVRVIFGAAFIALAACQDMENWQGTDTSYIPDAKPYWPVDKCVNISNSFSGEYEGHWTGEQTFKFKDLLDLKRVGVDSIRFNVNYDVHTQDRYPYKIDQVWLKRTKEVVDQALGLGLAVILDFHIYEEAGEKPYQHFDRWMEIWRQLSDQYEGYPPELIFEPLNEPFGPLDSALWNEWVEAVTKLIRKKHPNRVLVFGGSEWNSAESLKRMKVPSDPNIVVAVHYYEPWAFTHQGAHWIDEYARPPVGKTWPGSSDEYTMIKRELDDVQAWGEAHNREIWIGEFGVPETISLSQRLNWTEFMIGEYEKRGFSWCIYDYYAGFGIKNRIGDYWYPGMLETMGLKTP